MAFINKPKTNHRPQPYRLKWPWSASQVENTDEMFEMLFKRIKALEDSLTTKTTGVISTSQTLLIDLGGGDSGDGDPGPPGISTPGTPGATGPTGPQGLFGFALDGSDGDDGITVPGTPGPTGSAGSNGATGPQGPIGLGLDGADGEDGYPIPGPAGAGTGGGTSGIPIPIGTNLAGKRVTWAQKGVNSGVANAIQNVGVAVVNSTGTGGVTVNDSSGFWLRPTTTASTNNVSTLSAADSFTRADLLPKFQMRIRTPATITSIRLLFGINEQIDVVNGGTVSDDNPTASERGFYFRFSTSAGDAGWMAMSRDTAGLTTSAQIGANLVASTIYVLTITVKSASQVTFDVNGTSVDITTNIPTTTTLGWGLTVTTLTTAARSYDIGSLYLESN